MKNTCEIFNKDGQRAIDAKSIESLTECVFALPQTKTFHLDKNGDYTAERKKLHEEIIKDFKDDVICIDKGKPIAVLMGGSPASGKSTFLKKYRPYLLSDNLFKVDADEIRARLPEYKGWNATQTHEETGDIVKTLISDKNIGIPCKFDFIYDGTMTSVKKYLALIDLLKSEGYEVFVVFISNIPQADVKKRALERYQKSGRFVPMMVVDDFYKNGEDTFKQVKTQVDGYIVVDGSTFDYNVMEKGGKSLPNKRLYEKLGHKIELKNGGQMKTYKIIYKGNIRIETALNEQAAIEQAKQKLSMFYGNIPDSQLIAIEMEIPSNKFEEGGKMDSFKGTLTTDALPFLLKDLPYNYQIENNTVFGDTKSLEYAQDLLKNKYNINLYWLILQP
jgi:predicted ABC-type ATPase